MYLLPYKLGIRKRYRLPCRVICVGNLTFGGTGKSPAVRAVCERLLERGFHPAILSRGHGGRLSSTGAIVSDKQKRLIDAVDCGDEPALLADSLPGVPVAIGKDRRKIGRVLLERFSPDVIVLDDGMQYWQLHRDAEIVLVNAERPFGTGRLLPSGDLREPIRGIRRADAVVITGTEATAPERVDSVRNDLAERVPWVEVFTAKRQPSALVDSNTGERLPVERLQGMPVVAVSGIARPWSFETMLRDCGADVRQRVRFGDHCAYAKGEIDAISAALEKTGAEAVVTTAKDAVKLRLRTKMYVMEIELVVEDIDRLIDIAIGTGLETQVGSSQA
jgi:tetraacyldisaccharide 4'-kinase